MFVSNDTQPNKLYHNNHNGTFTEEGVRAGVAFGEDGVARGAMGVDAADYDRSGRMHLLVGNFSNQMLGLYHNEGNGLFVDEAPRSTVGRASLLTSPSAAFFSTTISTAGRISSRPTATSKSRSVASSRRFSSASRRCCSAMQGKGRFDDVSKTLGPDFARPMVARGAAYADFDHDGDLDLLVSTNNGPAYLLRNDGGNRNHWLSLRLVGTKSNRDAIGAVVRLRSASGEQMQMVHSGSSYCSQSDLALTFGLGQDAHSVAFEIWWPGGTKERITNVAPDQFVTIEEGRGIIYREDAMRR